MNQNLVLILATHIVGIVLCAGISIHWWFRKEKRALPDDETPMESVWACITLMSGFGILGIIRVLATLPLLTIDETRLLEEARGYLLTYAGLCYFGWHLMRLAEDPDRYQCENSIPKALRVVVGKVYDTGLICVGLYFGYGWLI